MNQFRGTADASSFYRPTSAAGTVDQCGTATSGTLADVVRNSSTFRVIPSTTTTVSSHTTVLKVIK